MTQPLKSIEDLQFEADQITMDIERITVGVKDLEETVIPTYAAMAKELANNGDLGKRASASESEYKKMVENRKVELIELQERLTDLQSQISKMQI